MSVIFCLPIFLSFIDFNVLSFLLTVHSRRFYFSLHHFYVTLYCIYIALYYIRIAFYRIYIALYRFHGSYFLAILRRWRLYALADYYYPASYSYCVCLILLRL